MRMLAVFQAQVDAFNMHDVDAFLATYAHDAVVGGGGANPLFGKEQMRQHYTRRLSSPSLRCEVDTVVEFGTRWVVAHEFITEGTTSTEVVATFEIVDDLIIRSSHVQALRSDFD